VTALKAQKLKIFDGKDAGELGWYLGMKITRDCQNQTMVLSQTAYIQNIIKKGLDELSAPTTIPLHPNNLKRHLPATPNATELMAFQNRQSKGSKTWQNCQTKHKNHSWK
jgi:hypothetical protein